MDLGAGEGARVAPARDEAFFFVFTFKICLPHQSVMPFFSGAPPPKENPGSTRGQPMVISNLYTEGDLARIMPYHYYS